jgi:hypothetical protein
MLSNITMRLYRMIFSAGSRRASSGEDAVSSGSLPMPARKSAAPTAGFAVTTQSGTAKARPPAIKSA